MMNEKVKKAIEEASISIACLLDDLDYEYYDLTTDVEHIQDQITIIENGVDNET